MIGVDDDMPTDIVRRDPVGVRREELPRTIRFAFCDSVVTVAGLLAYNESSPANV